MRNADELQADFKWWLTRWILLPGAIFMLFVALALTHIETRKCMKSCRTAGFTSYIYATHRWRAATCDCVNAK
jgi:hypothetical protein